jgi:hypothetical protein
MRVVGKARRLVSVSCHIKSPLAPTDPNNALSDQQETYATSSQLDGLAKCSCGREVRTFDACTPAGCSTFVVCVGCSKDIEKCLCTPST